MLGGLWRRDHEETEVEVAVRRLTGRLHPVHVDIDRRDHDAQAVDTGLLGGFPKGDGSQVGVPVA